MALFGPTGGCLGGCDGCHAGGLHTGRPSSAHAVTPLTTLLSLSDPVTKAESDRYREGEITQETERVGGISFQIHTVRNEMLHSINLAMSTGPT